MTADQAYKTVKDVCDEFDEIYEEYIVYLVGYEGLHLLQKNRLVEACDIVHGRQLYTLCNKH